MNLATRKFLTNLSVIAAAFVCAQTNPADAWAQHKGKSLKDQIAGDWTLVSNTASRPDGSKMDVFGTSPKGLYIFERSGRFAIINVRPDLPKFASGNRMQGTPDENKAIVQGSIALFGTYTVNEADKVLVLNVEGSTWPTWTGTEQKRPITLKGDTLSWTLAASVGGTATVVLKRLK